MARSQKRMFSSDRLWLYATRSTDVSYRLPNQVFSSKKGTHVKVKNSVGRPISLYLIWVAFFRYLNNGFFLNVAYKKIILSSEQLKVVAKVLETF